jgi:hypothetical protein
MYIKAILKIGMQSVPDTENFHNLTWLSAQYDFIERMYHCMTVKSHKNQ